MLEIKNVVKRWGSKTALNGISLSFEKKGVYAVLAVDGGGKTTLGRVLCGCVDADEGEIICDNKKMSRKSKELKRRIRFVPQTLEADGSMTAFEYLGFVGECIGVESEKRYRQIKEAFELLGLDECQNKLLKSLGKTDTAKLSLAAALIGNPEVIVLDETLKEFDSDGGNQCFDILRMLGKIKTIIILSSDTAKLKGVCDRIAVVSGGKIVLEGSIDEIEDKINATKEVRITVRGDGERIIGAIMNIDGILSAKIISSDKNDVHSISVEYAFNGEIKDKLFEALTAINAPMLSIKPIVLTISDVFYSLTEEDRSKKEDVPKKSGIEKGDKK